MADDKDFKDPKDSKDDETIDASVTEAAEAAQAADATEPAEPAESSADAESTEPADDKPAVPFGIVYDDEDTLPAADDAVNADHKPQLDQTDALIAAALGLPADAKKAEPASKEKPAEAAPVMVASKIDREISDDNSLVFSSYPTLAFKRVSYAPKRGENLLEDVDLAFYDRRVYAVVVSSDEQRVAVLSLLSALTRPTSGHVMFKSKDMDEITGSEFRGHFAGLVLQRNSLRGDLSVLDNIVNAMEASGRNFLKPKPLIAEDLLEEVGFPTEHNETKASKLPDIHLRRAAIAKALSCEPAILIADEPVAGLEDPTRSDILNILKKVARKDNKTVIIVTADAAMAAEVADKVYTL
ncbi:ATP-binding cassette domain-containing protein [Bifidobacterium vespertilionis]|uniref:ATP-binding cassette domain-containing protein n=1 Tax=Bifidobacterium vespertilionis TaxID=2562524 RepID=UPI001BDCAF19|nr:ATP-binding cassette domain-containing protein [Bifidobacterium vespertilionis]MBT1180328.1 ATP-binding cassette domain-containing protein [Bifidobacterium vespertilionis]